MSILIKNILALMPDDKEKFVLKTIDLTVTGDKISKITVKENDSAETPDEKGFEKVIDGKDKLLLPGLINSHTHAYMNFMRNVADDVPFMDWLFKKISPIEDVMTEEDCYWGTNLAIAEMLRSGTTCFNDMLIYIMPTLKAIKESGIRAAVSRGLVGNGNDEGGALRIRQTLEGRDAYKDCDRIDVFMAPHAPYTCDEEYMRIVEAVAEENNMPIHTHLAESKSEIAQIKEKYGCTPIEMAERNGLFRGRCIAAHCVNLTEKDIEILKRNNVTVATNPVSNMKLGNGFAPVPELMNAGVNVALGTDGSASNNNLNMFHEMSVLTLIHKGVKETAECVSAKEALEMATINGAKALGKENLIGVIAEGLKADLAILNLDTPSMCPRNNIIASLCYSANGSEVETVMVDGKILMENRVLLTIDEERTLYENEKIMKKIGKMIG